MEERQTNYTIAEGYELPSKGLIYDNEVSSHVELRSMTGRDELKRTSPSTTPFKTLADIIEGCMIEKPKVHVYDMALGDYEYLLHRLRVVTYGDEYKISLTCPFCGDPIEATTHLDDLTVKDFNIDEFNDLRTFTLPKSGKRITLNYKTPRMLDDIELKTKEAKKKYTTSERNYELLLLLTCIIDTVDGEKLSASKIEPFVNNLPALDMQKILNNSDKLNEYLGIDSIMYLDCPTCGETVKTFFRFGPEFFRPTNI